MRKLLLLLLLAPLAGKSQQLQIPVDTDTHKIDYQEVVRADGMSKEQLYGRAMEWFARTFTSARDIVQLDDAMSGKLVARVTPESYYPLLTGKPPYSIYYNIVLTLKDGRYRYEITDFEGQDFPDPNLNPHPQRLALDTYATDKKNRKANGEYKMVARYYLTTVNNFGATLSQSLKTTMAPSSLTGKNKDDF